MHGLRHIHYNLLFGVLLAVEEVKECLRHPNIRLTIKMYIHFTKIKKENRRKSCSIYYVLNDNFKKS